MIKVSHIQEIPGFPKLYGHICPVCGAILSSSPERSMLPEFMTCECTHDEKKKGNKQEEDYNIDIVFGMKNTYSVFRNITPRFNAIYDGEILRNIEFVKSDNTSISEKDMAIQETMDYIHANIHSMEPVYYLQQRDGGHNNIIMSGTKKQCEDAIKAYNKKDRGEVSIIHEYDYKK